MPGQQNYAKIDKFTQKIAPYRAYKGGILLT